MKDNRRVINNCPGCFGKMIGAECSECENVWRFNRKKIKLADGGISK